MLLTQIIRLRGGRVIGRVSSEDKVAVARQAGAEHVIVNTEGKFAEEVLRLTGGEGVDVVYDGSGPMIFKGPSTRYAAPARSVGTARFSAVPDHSTSCNFDQWF